MQLEIGKRYLSRNGQVFGPLENYLGSDRYPFRASQGRLIHMWTSEGLFQSDGPENGFDLVAEYHESEASPTVEALKILVKEPEDEDILMEALRLTSGDRQQQYGPPEKNLGTIAALWAAYKGVPFEARDVAAMMILVKVAREIAGPKRDTAVDIAGYARLLHLCNEAAAKQEVQ